MTTATEALIKSIRDDGREPLSLSISEARKEIGRTHVLSPYDSNLKLVKGQKVGWEAAGLSLAPYTLAGGPTLCPNSSPQCRKFCVSGSGNAIAFSMVNEARVALTKKLLKSPVAFIRVLIEDLLIYQRAALLRGKKFTTRLNVFSDIEWERVAPEIFEVAARAKIPLMDYTKVPGRVVPDIYSLTMSHSEINKWGLSPTEITTDGINLAVPFAVKRTEDLPKIYRGVKVIDGDKTDLRHLDPKGVIVGLRSKTTKKGKADLDGGFVLPIIQ